MWKATNVYRIIALGAFLVAFAIPGVVAAQEDDPLRLVYLNISGDEGAKSFQTVDDLFAESQQIELVDGEKLVELAAEYGLKRESFRSNRRAEYEDEFAALMWELNIEGVMVHDVDLQADLLYVGVIGPRGWELGEVEATLAQGALDREGALGALQEIFNPLVPEVRGFRRDVAEGRLGDDDFQLPEMVAEEEEKHKEEDEELSLREKAMAEHRKRYGNLERNLSMHVGPAFGHRSFRMNDEAGFDLRHRAPLMGLGLRVDALVTTFDRDTAALEVGGVFGFASVSTLYDSSDLDGQFFRMSGEARYINAQSALLRFRGIAGVETMNLSLAENEDYTGHGYFAARLGGGVEYDFGDLISLQMDGLLMPVIVANNSGESYGEAAGWLGLGADLAFKLGVAAPVLIGAEYGFRYFDIDYPDAGQVDGISGEAHSHDMHHHMMFTVGYRL